VTDVEILFNVIKGKDKMDATSIDLNPKSKSLKPKVIGVPYHIMEQDGIEEDVRKNFSESIEKLKKLGYEIKDIKLPSIPYALAVYYIIMPAEVSSNLARFDGVKYGMHVDGKNLLEDYLKTRREGFGPEVRRRILIGTYVLSTGYYDAFYNKANVVRQKISEELANAFKDVDVIATPTTPSPAFKIGEKIDDPLSMYLADIFTVTANIVGIPAISIPSGTVKNLPVGLQMMASHGAEETLFDIGKKFLGE
jgi:aspartyl-tRNA(Asn)/glutamyl-tRNA(Gln) amidotransferase subunit A